MVAIVDSKLMYYSEHQRKKPTLSLFNTLARVLKSIEYSSSKKVTSIIFAYDIGKSDYRLGIWPRYKAKRVYHHLPDDFKHVYENVVKQIADSLGIYSFPIQGVEADDIVSILTNKITEDVVLISNDHDYLQIPIQHKDRVSLFYLKGWKLLGYEESVEMSGCSTVEQFLIKKAATDDLGDNIRGILSIGKVRFQKWADEAFKLPDEDLKKAFMALCKGVKRPCKVHADYLEHAGISTCEELYDMNMALGRIMTGVKHLTLEQKVQLNACWVIYSQQDGKFDLDKAIALSEEFTTGHAGLFGDPWSLAECDLSIYERILNGKKEALSR